MSTPISKAPASIQELYQKAKAARENSYSPYSHCKVGSALRTKEGLVFTGCNVENSSYGGTVCAERVAILKAVSELGQFELNEIVVVTDASPPWPPCGLCRQVISEFIHPSYAKNMVIYMTNLQGEVVQMKWEELFPLAFTPSHLLK